MSGNGRSVTTTTTTSRTESRTDRRVVRTRRALAGAFTALLLEGRYDRITIADIVDRADVGRSTFYEHFADKDAILADSIRGPFTPLAALASSRRSGDAVEPVARVLAHFWQQQGQARFVFDGSARRPVGRILAAMIEDQLRARVAEMAAAAPLDLVAVAVADAILGAITTWLGGRGACTAVVLADVLQRMVQGMVAGLR